MGQNKKLFKLGFFNFLFIGLPCIFKHGQIRYGQIDMVQVQSREIGLGSPFIGGHNAILSMCF